MTLPAALAIAIATLGFALAAFGWRVARAPGWQELRWLSFLAITAGFHALFDAAATLRLPEETVVWASRVSLAALALHGPGWLFYLASREARRPRAREFAFAAAGAAVALLAFAPGVLVADTVEYRYVEWLETTYAVTKSTPRALLALGLCSAPLIPALISFLRDALHGKAEAISHCAGLLALLLAVAFDTLVISGWVAAPPLLSLGLIAAVTAAGGSKIGRFIEQARTLDTITRELELEVERRSNQLTAAQAALEHAERLAAVGRLAAGVAHEINNPATVLLANLEYLQQRMSAEGKPPSDTAACLEESAHAVRRVSRIVRQLVDAGRVARSPVSAELRPVELLPVVRKAIDAACVACPNEAEILVHVNPGVWARGDATMLEQVLLNLVVNALHSVEAGAGRLEVAAATKGDQVVIDVSDDGPGIPKEIRSRVFEPFVTTKPFGKGTGLGLSVSRGLMKSQRGDLSVASTSSRGTTMRVTLGMSPPPTSDGAAEKDAAAERKLSLLLVDDEAEVRDALSRQLGPSFDVTAVDGVTSALERLASTPRGFDVVLCDIMMPDGGGQRFAKEIAKAAPELAARTIYFTGAATDEAAREFFEALGPRGMHKPVDSTVLLELARSLLERPASAA
ncbi:MAG TPA: ATP-binding protein [Polyangiaceae bacterium]|nr:ATP-binding protein [Polyangiaceae bacterium]